MSNSEMVTVINEWITQYEELGKKYKWVQVFENRGKMMGCSNPHPHCQIWATDCLPNLPEKADQSQLKYLNGKKIIIWLISYDYLYAMI